MAGAGNRWLVLLAEVEKTFDLLYEAYFEPSQR